MILIDSNSLLVLIIGLINPNLISTNKRTSIYEKEDFDNLIDLVGDFSNLLVLPNIWTEVDNLLNQSFSRNYKDSYIQNLKFIIESSTEKYLESKISVNSSYFYELGITDSLILEVAKDCKFIITSDSKLSDNAKANNIQVYDLVEIRNNKLKSLFTPKL